MSGNNIQAQRQDLVPGGNKVTGSYPAGAAIYILQTGRQEANGNMKPLANNVYVIKGSCTWGVADAGTPKDNLRMYLNHFVEESSQWRFKAHNIMAAFEVRVYKEAPKKAEVMMDQVSCCIVNKNLVNVGVCLIKTNIL